MVIVRAGWAGLWVARDLMNVGITNILVLEAADYVGGRSKTGNKNGSTNTAMTSRDNVLTKAGSEWLYNHNGIGDYLNATNLVRTCQRRTRSSTRGCPGAPGITNRSNAGTAPSARRHSATV